jgi:hypothetical protein
LLNSLATIDLCLGTKQAYQTYRRIAAEDFVTLTSAAINAEIDQRYHPFTAGYIKQAWAEVHFRQLAEAYGWQAADNALTVTSIVDFAAFPLVLVDFKVIPGILAAYVQPRCRASMGYPCTTIDWTCRVLP